ncbi:MAG: TRAP transporter small permease subunit [Bacillota bacterium]
MEKFIKISDRISQGTGIIAGFMMILALVMVLVEIVLRTFFSKTLYITEEYTAYLMVGITFIGLAYTLKEKGHIRMSFLQTVLRDKARMYLEIYALIVGLIFFTLITYTTTNFFWDSVVSQSRSMSITSTYLAIPQFFMPLGSLIMTLQFIAEIMRTIVKLRSGEIDSDDVETKALGR